MKMNKMIDYNELIAEAAREYVREVTEYKMYRTEEHYNIMSKSYNKLCWFLDAKKYNWNPEDYKEE